MYEICNLHVKPQQAECPEQRRDTVYNCLLNLKYLFEDSAVDTAMDSFIASKLG